MLADDIRKSRNDEHVARRFLSTVDSARGRRLQFSLELKDVRRLMNTEKCFYSGVRMNRITDDDNQLTFDRVDNTKGYVKGNVVACTKKMNALKSNITVEEFKMFFKALKRKKLI